LLHQQFITEKSWKNTNQFLKIIIGLNLKLHNQLKSRFKFLKEILKNKKEKTKPENWKLKSSQK